MHIFEELMKCVVRIEATSLSGQCTCATGFAYRFNEQDNGEYVSAIVTNKHVIKEASQVTVPISIADNNGNLTGKYEEFVLEINESSVLHHPNDNIDLCAIFSGSLLQSFQSADSQAMLYYISKSITATDETFSEHLPLEEVVMVGYPTGLWDSTNNGAIARRGIIATIPSDDFLGKKQFVVDMACFPGSSGSPVFIANCGSFNDRKGALMMGTRVILLGILYAGPYYMENGEIVTTTIPSNGLNTRTPIRINLGYVIKATELDAMNDLLVRGT